MILSEHKIKGKMKVICSVLLLAFIFMQNHDISEAFGFHRVGGMSRVRPATMEIELLAAKMKEGTEYRLGRNFGMFKAESYATQVVQGTNYFIKVKVGEDDYVHLRVFQPLPYTGKGPSFVSALDKKGKTDALEYF